MMFTTDKTIMIWAAAAGESLFAMSAHTDWVNRVSWNLTGVHLNGVPRDEYRGGASGAEEWQVWHMPWT